MGKDARHEPVHQWELHGGHVGQGRVAGFVPRGGESESFSCLQVSVHSYSDQDGEEKDNPWHGAMHRVDTKNECLFVRLPEKRQRPPNILSSSSLSPSACRAMSSTAHLPRSVTYTSTSSAGTHSNDTLRTPTLTLFSVVCAAAVMLSAGRARRHVPRAQHGGQAPRLVAHGPGGGDAVRAEQDHINAAGCERRRGVGVDCDAYLGGVGVGRGERSSETDALEEGPGLEDVDVEF